jgi:hypothetical protein
VTGCEGGFSDGVRFRFLEIGFSGNAFSEIRHSSGSQKADEKFDENLGLFEMMKGRNAKDVTRFMIMML